MKLFSVVALLLTFSSPVALCDQILVTKDGLPGTYVPLDFSQADREISVLENQGTSQQPQVTPVSMTSSLAVSHGADTTVLGGPQSVMGGIPAIASRNANGTIPITSCSDITSPGHYVLTADLSSPWDCLTIHDTHDVQLDCAGHHIVSTRVVSQTVLVQAVNHFSMSNCDVSTNAGGESLSITGSLNVTVVNSVLAGVQVNNTTQGLFDNNHITRDYDQNASSYMTVSNNQFDHLDDSNFAAIWMSAGHHNNIIHNTIEGGWDGDLYRSGNQDIARVGLDDAIIVEDESNDQIVRNITRDTFDTGIEGVGSVTNTLMENNTITNAGFAGIGAYHGTSWIGNTLLHNTVKGSPQFLYITYDDNMENDPISYPYFKNNRIEGNIFKDPVPFAPVDGGGYSPDGEMPSAMSILFPPVFAGHSNTSGAPVVGIAVPRLGIWENNMIANNDFGTAAPPPELTPSSAFIDGGGNICAPSVTLLPSDPNCNDQGLCAVLVTVSSPPPVLNCSPSGHSSR